MIMECGVGAFSLAIYHLIAHGLFKGTLFLSAGSVIGQARKDDGVPKDELYHFVVEKKPARTRKHWLLMTAITLIVPIVIIIGAHWLVAQDFFHNQGAVILLFFGWLAGAQLVFVTYRMRTINFVRMFSLMMLSFIIVVLGYSVISHSFDLFLYSDQRFSARLYEAAGINVLWFDALVILITLSVAARWLRIYYVGRKGRYSKIVSKPIWMNIYALILREFYIIELYTSLQRQLDTIATRLNVWFRWV